MENKIEQSGTVKKENWKRLLEVAIHWNYGETRSHEEIGSILGISYRSGEANNFYRDQVRKANKELLMHGKGIKNVYGAGFEVVTPNEYYKWARKHERKSWRQLRKAINIIDSTPVEKLSRPELTIHLKTRDHLSRISVIVEEEKRDYAAELRAAKRELEQLRGKTNDETDVSQTEQCTAVTDEL